MTFAILVLVFPLFAIAHELGRIATAMEAKNGRG